MLFRSYLLINCYRQINIDLIKVIVVPVPLNKKRLLERGFNQSALLSECFARHFGLTCHAEIIERFRPTPHQVGLNKQQRQINVKNSFKIIKPELVKNKNIILIDDVVTTGSTLEEVAKTLKQNGAQKVIGLVVAKD